MKSSRLSKLKTKQTKKIKIMCKNLHFYEVCFEDESTSEESAHGSSLMIQSVRRYDNNEKLKEASH